MFNTAEEFSKFIESNAISENITCLEALKQFCEKNSVDIESIKDNITPSLKEKLRANFEDINYLPKSPKL